MVVEVGGSNRTRRVVPIHTLLVVVLLNTILVGLFVCFSSVKKKALIIIQIFRILKCDNKIWRFTEKKNEEEKKLW